MSRDWSSRKGESLTVQPIGTPGLLLVKNLGFDAPGFETGMPTDFTTDLAVFQDGQEIARKTIRVNDPLVDRWLHLPPERLRAGTAPRHPRYRGQAAVGRPGPPDRLGRGLALRDDGRPRPGLRAAAAPDRDDEGRGVVLVLPVSDRSATDADGCRSCRTWRP